LNIHGRATLSRVLQTSLFRVEMITEAPIDPDRDELFSLSLSLSSSPIDLAWLSRDNDRGRERETIARRDLHFVTQTDEVRLLSLSLSLSRARECCGSAGRCETIELARARSRSRSVIDGGWNGRDGGDCCYLRESEFRITDRERGGKRAARGGPGRVTEKRGRERDLAPFYDRFTTTSCCHGHGGATVFFELHAGFSQMRIFLFFLFFFFFFFFFFYNYTLL